VKDIIYIALVSNFGCNLIVGLPNLVLFSVYTLPTALFVLFRPS
jgi:hypothetical protein